MSDVLVVGAGIIGASIAYHCAKAGAKVHVVDNDGIGKGASGKSFGWINASFAESDAYFALRHKAIDKHRALARELDIDQTTQWNGCIWWEDEGNDFWDQARELTRRAYPHEIIETDKIHQLEPNLAGPPAHAILTEHEGAANGTGLSNALLANVIADGGTVSTDTEVIGILRDGENVVGVKTNKGDLFADSIIIAVGAASETLLATAEINLPMDNQRGIILQTTPTKPLINHIIMSTDVHFRQNPDGRFTMGEIFSGGGLNDAIDKDVDAFAARMLARLHARLPAAKDVEISHIHQGLRPVPKDGFPAIGAIGGLYVATMHSGITLAPLVGKMAAQEILHGHTEKMLAEFRPNRFA